MQRTVTLAVPCGCRCKLRGISCTIRKCLLHCFLVSLRDILVWACPMGSFFMQPFVRCRAGCQAWFMGLACVFAFSDRPAWFPPAWSRSGLFPGTESFWLIYETASAQEFPQDRSRRDFLFLYGEEIREELEEAVGFPVMSGVFRNSPQQGFGILLEDT